MLTTPGLEVRALHNSKLCAIGQETADALAGRGLRPELVTSEYTAEGLANALEGWEMAGMRVLVPRAEIARDALPSLLTNRGAEVEILPVYRAMCPADAGPALLRLFDGDARLQLRLQPEVLLLGVGIAAIHYHVAPQVGIQLGETRRHYAHERGRHIVQSESAAQNRVF